jgi:hypothetical protein
MPPPIAATRLSPILQVRKLVSDPHLPRAIRFDTGTIVKNLGKSLMSIPSPWRYIFPLGLLSFGLGHSKSYGPAE